MSELIACETVTSAACMASDRARGDGIRGIRCYRCGLGTCLDCSSVQQGRIMRGGRSVNGRVRMCDNCLDQEPDGPARTLLRRYHEAGYPQITLEDTRGYIASTERAANGRFSSLSAARPVPVASTQPRQPSRRRLASPK